jgi:GntR family transcriptional regulator
MEFTDKQAIYMQIADYFCERILNRQWAEGEKIPSIRDTAVQLEVNPNTVFRTYNFLQDKGIIFNKRGIGYFVCNDGFRKTMSYKKESFVNDDLPKVFQTMDMLKMDTHDLEKQYDIYKKESA